MGLVRQTDEMKCDRISLKAIGFAGLLLLLRKRDLT